MCQCFGNFLEGSAKFHNQVNQTKILTNTLVNSAKLARQRPVGSCFRNI